MEESYRKKYICVNRIMSFGDLTVSRERHCFGIPIDDLTINIFFFCFIILKKVDFVLLWVCFSYNKSITDSFNCPLSVTFLFSSHFDIICALFLNRHMATWNLFVLKITTEI